MNNFVTSGSKPFSESNPVLLLPKRVLTAEKAEARFARHGRNLQKFALRFSNYDHVARTRCVSEEAFWGGGVFTAACRCGMFIVDSYVVFHEIDPAAKASEGESASRKKFCPECGAKL